VPVIAEPEEFLSGSFGFLSGFSEGFGGIEQGLPDVSDNNCIVFRKYF